MGGRGGALRVKPKAATAPVKVVAAPAAQATPPANTPDIDVTTLASMDDAKVTATIKKAFKAKIDADQQDADTQRFFNSIGWADRQPRVLDEAHFEGARKAAGKESLFHTDAPMGQVADAKVFADQFMGKGRHFLSGGYHGDGTYFATDSSDSWNYGHGSPRANQFKAFLSSRAKVITQPALMTKMDTWARSHPQGYQALVNCSQGYFSRGADTRGGSMSIFAAMLGYNVIKTSCYYTVLDRSAITCCKRTKHYGDADTDGSARTW